MRLAERHHAGVIGQLQRHQLRMFGNAGIARRGIELAQQWRLGQFPAKRMFAPTRPDQQDIHGIPFRAR